MAYMIVKNSVKDYDTWKSVFDSKSDLRKSSGEKSHQILREVGDANNLVVVNEWDSLDRAREFAASPELKAAMEQAGVTSKPEISFLEEAAQG